MADLRWGIVGTGAIARRYALELRESASGRLVAVGSRTIENAEAFAGQLGPARPYGSYEALLEDPEVEAVYIATPHPHHARWAILAAEAGKHVLCEKPLTLHRGDAEAVVEAARGSGVFLMEAFMYRCHPQTARVVELLASGVIGEVRFIEAVHSFAGSAEPTGRLLANELGGGAILDVGCYCMSGARLMAGVAGGGSLAVEPEVVTGAAHVGPTGVDGWAVASLRFAGGVVAQLTTSVQVAQPPSLRLYGSKGSMSVPAPWLPGVDGARVTEIVVTRHGGEPERHQVHADRGLYAIEADEVARCIAAGLVESPAMPWADTLGNMAALDRWRRAVGVIYDAERPAALTTPLRGRPLRRRGELPTGRISGVGKPLSRVVLGTMLAFGDDNWPTAMAVFDEFLERGGNVFDSARRYGEGESDRALGQWMQSRGVRDDVVVIAKGAHTPHCDPDTLTRELFESLDDLRCDSVDLYFLHRDNHDVPVGEFVELLNEHHRAGRVDAFGGSNWTSARVDEANAYAHAHGLVGFTAVSNQFSLARMVAPTFPGCLSASEPEFQRWIERTGIAVVAWSSQAAGFFAGVDDPVTGHAWDDDDNRARRERAKELASARGSTPSAVALAWVLSQSLPLFPVIGPRSLAELRTSLEAIDLQLNEDECAWLDLARPSR